MTKIYLLSEDAMTNHSQGNLDSDVVDEYRVVERNSHIYEFSTTNRDGSVNYVEVKQPYCITEF